MAEVKILDAAATRAALPWPELILALERDFPKGCEAPLRHQHSFAVPNHATGTLLLMPAWMSGAYLGVKQVCVMPDNAHYNLPSVMANYSLMNANTGALLAILDGGELTNRRTAAASALAAKFLARKNAKNLLIVGTGGLAKNLAAAHSQVRDIEQTIYWGRDRTKTEQIHDQLSHLPGTHHIADSLESACKQADIISCATSSSEPLVHGAWLQSGTHLDLVGSFKPDMREADEQAIAISDIYVDTREGALAEAGELSFAGQAGLFSAEDIQADLAELCAGQHQGRTRDEQITCFKSVGTALEDLSAAVLAFNN
ncbi:MAG: ornithine cyclodeaminase family protein [Pseudomonadota bacterium]